MACLYAFPLFCNVYGRKMIKISRDHRKSTMDMTQAVICFVFASISVSCAEVARLRHGCGAGILDYIIIGSTSI